MAVLIVDRVVVTANGANTPMAVFRWIYLVFGFLLGGSAIVTLSSDDGPWWGCRGASPDYTLWLFSSPPCYGPLQIKSPCPVAFPCLGYRHDDECGQ